MGILSSEGVLVFAEHCIPLQIMGEPKCAIRAQVVKDIALSGMAQCIVDLYVDCLGRILLQRNAWLWILTLPSGRSMGECWP